MPRLDNVEINFLTDFTTELLSNAPRREFDNIDLLRFPGPSTSSLKKKFFRLAASRNLYRPAIFSSEQLHEVLSTTGLADVYELLADRTSKELFIKLLVYRVLGGEHVRLPLNDQRFWEQREQLSKYVEKANAITGIPIVGSLDLFNFDGIRMFAHPLNIEATFFFGAYRYPSAGIGVESGDVVVDAGACWGDTALRFAQTARRVICFECMPANLDILAKNLSLNPELAQRITVLPKAAWDHSGQSLQFEERGPGSQQGSSGPSVKVETQTIDEAVSSLDRVDFIKMDIEGSEPKALIGAEKTIRKFRPQLAISIYHDLGHFASIPNWIHTLDLGYKFYVGHFSIHTEETVLFARSQNLVSSSLNAVNLHDSSTEA